MLKPKRLRFQSRLKRASCDWASHSNRCWEGSCSWVTPGREVAHVEIYEEKADIHKEAFVRGSQLKVESEVEAQETLRREELDVDRGTPIVDTSERLPKDRI